MVQANDTKKHQLTKKLMRFFTLENTNPITERSMKRKKQKGMWQINYFLVVVLKEHINETKSVGKGVCICLISMDCCQDNL